MNCSECDGKIKKLDKKLAGWILIALAVLTSLQLNPTLSFKFGLSTYLWLVIYMVPALMLLRSKPRYNYWCSNCKRMVSPKETENK